MKRLLLIGALLVALALSACGSQSAASASNAVQAKASQVLAVEDLPAADDAEEEAATHFFKDIEGDAQAISHALGNVPHGATISAFSLMNPDAAPSIPEPQLAALQQAVDDIGVPAAFLLVDAETGEGIQYNAEWASYAASSSKAWFALFLCQMAETDALSLEDGIYGGTDYPLALAANWRNDYCVGAFIENAVMYSDNSAYEALRSTYEWLGYDQWLNDCELHPIPTEDRTWYPDLSPVMSVQLWMNVQSFLDSGAKSAPWLKDLLANTNYSFLRQGLEDAGMEASVLNKAGWDVLSTCDSGVVTVNGRTYFASVHTQLNMGDESFRLVGALSAALFDAALALHQTAVENTVTQ